MQIKATPMEVDAPVVAGGAGGAAAAAEASLSNVDEVVLSVNVEAEFEAYRHGKETDAFGLVTLKAPLFESEMRAPIDLSVVIDRSGSMSGSKLELCKKTLECLMRQLKDSDRLGLVTYDTSVAVEFDLMFMSAKNKDKARDIVKRLDTGGCTDLCAGLLEGCKMLRDAEPAGNAEERVRSVLLLTDGHANSGITTTPGMVQAMQAVMRGETVEMPDSEHHMVQQRRQSFGRRASQRVGTMLRNAVASYTAKSEKEKEKEKENEKRGTQKPFSVYTFGYGSDHNDSLLRAISEAGAGMYYYVEDEVAIGSSFADCLGGLLSVVGQNIVVTLTARNGNGATLKKVHTKFPYAVEGGAHCVTIADIQSEEERNVLFEFTLPNENSPCDQKAYIDVTVSYFNVISKRSFQDSTSLSLSRPTNVPDGVEASETVEIQRLRVESAEALEVASAKAAEGKYDECTSMLKEKMAMLKSRRCKDNAIVKGLVSNLESCSKSMGSAHTYSRKGKYTSQNACQQMYVERSNVSSDCAYTTPTKRLMKAGFF